MTPEEQDIRMQAMWDSRKETLVAMLKRSLETLDAIEPHDAIVATVPLANLLVHVMDEFSTGVEAAHTNDLINKALKDESI
jgi:hypothetical protein